MRKIPKTERFKVFVPFACSAGRSALLSASVFIGVIRGSPASFGDLCQFLVSPTSYTQALQAKLGVADLPRLLPQG